MADTYCGKECEACTHRESLHCPGCKAGPGRIGADDCELAACCRGKDHETCESCIFKGNCATRMNRNAIPLNRQNRQTLEAERNAAIARCAPLMGTYVWYIFWLLVPNILGALLRSFGDGTVLYWLGTAAQLLCAVANGVMLMKLTPLSPLFRAAGLCTLISYVGNTLVNTLTSNSTLLLRLLLLIVLLVVSLVGEYKTYYGFADVLDKCDALRAEKWRKLWYWQLGSLGALAVSIVFLLLFLFSVPTLGLILLLAAAVFSVVVGIMKYVYLYQTAKFFREFQVSPLSLPE